MQHIIEKTLRKPLGKPLNTPSPPNRSVHQSRQIFLEDATYKRIIVDNTEYVEIGLYHKALEAFFKLSAGEKRATPHEDMTRAIESDGS